MITWKRIAIALVALHTLLMACYTFPEGLVPARARVIGQLYARPLFHQQWRLFAPDPPMCDCAVEVGLGESEWRPLVHAGSSYLMRRMAQGIARNTQRALADGASGPDEPTALAMRAMVRDLGREGGHLRFRLVEHCVAEPGQPAVRTMRITSLALP